MASYHVSVYKALTASQRDLIDHKEHCSADPEKLATVGRALGHQLRIKRNDSQYALYTVSQVRQETPDNIVRMGDSGRNRLGTSSEFAAALHSQVPHPTFNDAEAEAYSEFVERLDDDGVHTGLIVIAPHGGDIERHTDQQAERVVSRLKAKGVSSWRCKGFKEGGGASDRWHITSTDIHEASFPRLKFGYPSGLHLCGRLPRVRRTSNRCPHWRRRARIAKTGNQDDHQWCACRLGHERAHRFPIRGVWR
jgi:hypothetical protein